MTFANDFDTCPESLPSSQQSSCNLTGLWQSGARTEIRFAPCEGFSPYVLKDTSGEILIESGSKGKGWDFLEVEFLSLKGTFNFEHSHFRVRIFEKKRWRYIIVPSSLNRAENISVISPWKQFDYSLVVHYYSACQYFLGFGLNMLSQRRVLV